MWSVCVFESEPFVACFSKKQGAIVSSAWGSARGCLASMSLLIGSQSGRHVLTLLPPIQTYLFCNVRVKVCRPTNMPHWCESTDCLSRELKMVNLAFPCHTYAFTGGSREKWEFLVKRCVKCAYYVFCGMYRNRLWKCGSILRWKFSGS